MGIAGNQPAIVFQLFGIDQIQHGCLRRPLPRHRLNPWCFGKIYVSK